MLEDSVLLKTVDQSHLNRMVILLQLTIDIWAASLKKGYSGVETEGADYSAQTHKQIKVFIYYLEEI